MSALPQQIQQPESPASARCRARILWLAAADARGHLMRAHLMRRSLADVRIGVDIVTTAQEGVDFLREMGSPAEVFTEDFGVRYDGKQNLDRVATHLDALGYVFDPRRMRVDLGKLAERAAEYDLLVNDFHPSFLLAPWSRRIDTPVVHVHGRNLWRAVTRPFEKTVLEPLNRFLEPAMEHLRARGIARLVHHPTASFEIDRKGPEIVLPPIVDFPRRSTAEVRRELGVQPGESLIVAYFNPYFHDPVIAAELERVCEEGGDRLYAVGEGFAGREAWCGYDDRLVDKVAAADVFVSAPGMGAIGLCRTLRRPFLMVVTDQPEQRANADAFLAGERPPRRVVELASKSWRRELRSRIRELVAAPAEIARPVRVDRLWHQALMQIEREC